MKFITLRDGSSVRAADIRAIRVYDALPRLGSLEPVKPRVNVHVTIGNYDDVIVLGCETNKERDELATLIRAEIESATLPGRITSMFRTFRKQFQA